MVVIMFVVMIMFVVVLMFMVVIMVRMELRFAPGAPEHPAGNQYNRYPRDQLKPGFGGLRVPAAAKPQAGHGDQPDHCRMGNRRRQPQQHRLF